MHINPLLLTDSYKLTHWKQYPPKTTHVYSYFEARGGKSPETVFFGLQYLLKEHLCGSIVTLTEVNKAEELAAMHFGRNDLFNRAGWDHIRKDHKGMLPVRITAVPEGTPVPISNVLMTVENTCPQCYWLTNYLETLLVQTWYPTTVATLSRNIKKLILRYLDRTGTPELVDFKLHDFGYRGVSSVESAAWGGLAHLVNFKGTDTLAALAMGRFYYNEQCAGFSIAASEHSTITGWGPDKELDAFRNMLQQYPDGLVACVSDSYNIFNACSELWGTVLHDEVMARNGTLVVRPDSGNPAKTVLQCLHILGDRFGYATNPKGYKVLDPHVRIIQGDGVEYDSIEEILHQMQVAGWSADNIAFGMGGALLQKLHRDTHSFAFKASALAQEGVWHDVWKNPVTDGTKTSKRGKLALVEDEEGHLHTVPKFSGLASDGAGATDLLRIVFENGQLAQDYHFKYIRERAALEMPVSV